MAQGSTLYRFRIELSDIDRGVYDALDLRVAMHPSESVPFLLTRVLAYALNAREGLEFAPGGLSDTESPTLSAKSADGTYDLWIEIGNPSSKRAHKASKASRELRIYSYKDVQNLLKELGLAQVHRSSEIGIFSLPPEFLSEVGRTLGRDNIWTLTVQDGGLMLTTGESVLQCELGSYRLP